MKTVNAGEMFGFQIINQFPDASTEEEWAEFADNMARILSTKDDENTVSA